VVGPGHAPNFSDGGEAIVHFSDVAIGFPRITPGPVNAHARFSRSVFSRDLNLVIGPRTTFYLRHGRTPSGGFHHSPDCPAAIGQVSQRFDTGQKEIRATPDGCEGRQAFDDLLDRSPGNCYVITAILRAD